MVHLGVGSVAIYLTNPSKARLQGKKVCTDLSKVEVSLEEELIYQRFFQKNIEETICLDAHLNDMKIV